MSSISPYLGYRKAWDYLLDYQLFKDIVIRQWLSYSWFNLMVKYETDWVQAWLHSLRADQSYERLFFNFWSDNSYTDFTMNFFVRLNEVMHDNGWPLSTSEILAGLVFSAPGLESTNWKLNWESSVLYGYVSWVVVSPYPLDSCSPKTGARTTHSVDSKRIW